MNDQMEMKSKSKHQICQKHRHSTHHHFAMKIWNCVGQFVLKCSMRLISICHLYTEILKQHNILCLSLFARLFLDDFKTWNMPSIMKMNYIQIIQRYNK